jgi:hypothetical protein
MRKMTFLIALAALATLVCLRGTALAENKVETKVVKYVGLADAVKQLKGKVVVVDFWADS